jgi:transglutaminase-like putative cysteine protease
LDERYLEPTWFLDSDHPEVVRYARERTAGAESDAERAVRLFYAVRDGIRYDPYTTSLEPETFKASGVVGRDATFCIPKAILLAAGARASGIPARLAFADVRNHLSTERLTRLLRTDLFVFHGYTELFLGGRWVKATPTFNLSLCEKFNVKPLEFNGRDDALLHPFDAEGKRHMEYVRDRGRHADMPLAELIRAVREAYPHLVDESGRWASAAGGAGFEAEAGLARIPGFANHGTKERT